MKLRSDKYIPSRGEPGFELYVYYLRIGISSGAYAAVEEADIILVENKPQDVTSLFLFGKATYRKMVQNLFRATGYNVIAIPLAAGVLYNQGIVISPTIGAFIISLSTVIVDINIRFLNIDKEK